MSTRTENTEPSMIGTNWMTLPAGEVTIEYAVISGPNDQTTQKTQTIAVESTQIGAQVVTNAQFDSFLRASDGFANKRWWEIMGYSAMRDRLRMRPASDPVFRDHVNFWEAIAFTLWISAKTGTLYRLPYEAEWLLATKQRDFKCFVREWMVSQTDGGYAIPNFDADKVLPVVRGRSPSVTDGLKSAYRVQLTPLAAEKGCGFRLINTGETAKHWSLPEYNTLDLIKRVQLPDAMSVFRRAEVLRQIAVAADPRTLPALLNLLNTGNDKEREHTCFALDWMADRVEIPIDSMIPILHDRSVIVRRHLHSIFLQMGKKAIPPLKHTALSDDVVYQMRTLPILADLLPHNEAVAFMMERLRHARDTAVKHEAILRLQALGDAKAVPLLQTFTNNTDATLAYYSKQAIREIQSVAHSE